MADELKKKKLKRLIKASNPIGIAEELNDLESELQKTAKNIDELDQQLEDELIIVHEELRVLDDKKADREELEKQINTIELIPGPKGDDGKDYTLTSEDKAEIASKIEVPVVEKIIEKTEVIKEQPIITNEIKEVAKYEERLQIVEKINTGKKKDLKIEAEQIGGLDKLQTETLNRAVGIVDQRTSFLINKVSNLQATVDNGTAGYTDEEAQDAVGAMVDTTLEYVDATPLLRRAALTGDITAPSGSNATTLATVNSNVGTFGSATQVAQVTVSAKGLVTAVSNIAITQPVDRSVLIYMGL